MNYKRVLSTRLIKPAKGHEKSLHNKMLIEERKGWRGDWYCWEHESSTIKPHNKYRLSELLRGEVHEINSVELNDGSILQIGDVIRHKETREFNKYKIKSFRIVPDHITKEDVCEVSYFDGKEDKHWTSRIDQIEIWKPYESYRIDIMDVRTFNTISSERETNKNLLLL